MHGRRPVSPLLAGEGSGRPKVAIAPPLNPIRFCPQWVGAGRAGRAAGAREPPHSRACGRGRDWRVGRQGCGSVCARPAEGGLGFLRACGPG